METWSRMREGLPAWRGLMVAVIVVYVYRAMKTWEVAKGFLCDFSRRLAGI